MNASLPKASLEQISSLLSEKSLLEIVRCLTKNQQATIANYEVRYATAPGDSYLGIVYRVSVEANVDSEVRKLSMIAKGIPANLARRKTWKIPSFFKNEVFFYKTVLPTLLDFERRKRGEKAQADRPFVPVPTCLSCHSDGEKDYIIMSDLGVEGFAISERTEGFSQEHCEAALEALGHFHGLSLAFKSQEPETFHKMVANMVEPYFRLDYESWYSGFLKNLQCVAIDAVAKEYPNSEYESKLRAFANENQYKMMCELVKPEEPYALPGHGDAWGPNFLYRYNSDDKSRPSNIRILDFQLMRYASPLLDVMFFLFSVTTKEQRDNGGFEQLLQHYHNAMSEAITDLGSDPKQLFPYSAFKQEVQKYGKFGLGMGIESVPISMMTSDSVADLDSLPGDQEFPLETFWKIPLIDSKEGRLRVADLVKFSVEQGYI